MVVLRRQPLPAVPIFPEQDDMWGVGKLSQDTVSDEEKLRTDA